jgi:hypothetical protein
MSWKLNPDLPLGDIGNRLLHRSPEIAIRVECQLGREQTWRDRVDLAVSWSDHALLTLMPRGPRPAARRRVRCASAALDWAYEYSQTALPSAWHHCAAHLLRKMAAREVMSEDQRRGKGETN